MPPCSTRPTSLHDKYDQALAQVKAGMGRDYGMLINNQDVFVESKFEDRSPIDTTWLLGTFQKGTSAHAQQALAAAQAAAPAWAATKWQDRVRLLRRAPPSRSRSASTRSARSCRWKWARTAWRAWATPRRRPT